jgi:hypothetical protein
MLTNLLLLASLVLMVSLLFMVFTSVLASLLLASPDVPVVFCSCCGSSLYSVASDVVGVTAFAGALTVR